MSAPGDDTTGASRRDVLRGGAIGMGAFVGAMTLINANEVSSEARVLPHRKLTVGFGGNGMNATNEVPLLSYAVGGVLDGSPTPSQMRLTLDTGKYSPRLLQVYAEAMTLNKIVILASQRSAQGLLQVVETVTVTGARITSFHTDAVATGDTVGSGHLRDSLIVTWGSLTILRHGVNTSYTWALPT